MPLLPRKPLLLHLLKIVHLRRQMQSSIHTMADEVPNYIVQVDDAKEFVKSSMEAIGTRTSHAQSLADLLVLADQRGHYSHGLNRLGRLLRCMQ